MDFSSRNRIVLSAHTHWSNVCIRMDENKILFGNHIVEIYREYSWNINGKSIYLVYTWYIPEKKFCGFQMDMKLMNALCLSHHIFYWCLAGKASPSTGKQRHFLDELFIKTWFCSKKMCLHCCMLSWFWLQFMIYHVSSLAKFWFSQAWDFGLNVLQVFPHIFSVLHRNSVETCWFSLVMHEGPLTEEISMQASLDNRISMLLPPVLAQSAFAPPK